LPDRPTRLTQGTKSSKARKWLIEPDPEDLPCWQRLDARITTSGRIAGGDIARLKAVGVRHVINMALADSPGALANEALLMIAADLRYTHIPVPFAAPQDAHFAAFRNAIESSREPVHVHCIMNWRVSAFFYRYNRDVRGMDEPAARALMEQQWSPESSENADAPAWARFIVMGAN
jgi:protein tyrosine phosphatase (PTP) superfamily phosphohydrolase (DUF442 family)